ncbi:MAG: TetR family transcriptional regulator [Chloroflexi bacterium]|nr:TetR family transcriptional regulator [Chloroflexota bacterium]
MTTDDRTTKARIRDAAIICIAHNSVADTTVRKVASVAEVSPGLVIHHYGSMEGLRDSCDTYIAASIRKQKQETIMSGANFDVMSVIRDSEVGSMGGYLASVLGDDSPAVAKLVDDLVADAEDYMEQGVESGSLVPTDNPRARATVISLWSLGALAMNKHVKRLMGVDLTNLHQNSDAALANYLNSVYEILGNGILTESVADQLRKTVSEAVAENQPDSQTTSSKQEKSSGAGGEGTS